ncbi:hypothetical protein GCM10009554_12150 [Kribbella koreensis]|uniref:SWIM-type domain-containing protein n=1 Tax=Kribbella koreensis TaxID=57909 RepID=A0ABN1PKM7_9ACTN
MSLKSSLIAQLRRFDDDAWAALANRGLLRRAGKDLTACVPEIVADSSAGLEIRVGSALVRFDERGPASATCDCPSGRICQHIIAAGLWLASTADSSPDDGPEQELLAITVEQLTEYAGKAGYRWALRYVDEIESAVRVELGRQVVLTLSSPRVTYRYVGGGPAGLMPDTELAAPERFQVAVVLAYQRLAGVGPPPAARDEQARSSHQLTDSRARLRSAATQLLTDTVRLGIAHSSASIHQRYETLAVWAQGAEYHRLARALSRIADHVEMLLDRSARADEHRLLDEAALAYALVCALEGSEQPRLMGQARGRYDSVRRMDLLGLGAYPWRAASGYHGLTALFWWPAENRFVAWTDARPESMPGFEPRGRYQGVANWDGMASPADATGAEVRLSDAKLSSSGRLSGAEGTRAAVVPLTGEALAAALPVVTRWADLARQPRSLLDVPAPLEDWFVLRPAVFQRPRFDPNSQSLSWGILDEQGETLTLVLPYTAENAHAISRIEALTDEDLGPETLLTAQLRPARNGLSGEPMSLIHPGRSAGIAVDPLHFGVAPAKQPAGRKVRPPADDVPVEWLPPVLEELRGWLVRRAERGTGAGAGSAVLAELASRHRAAREAGFAIFPDPATGDATGAEPAVAILRSCYLVQQVTQMLNQHSAFVVRG